MESHMNSTPLVCRGRRRPNTSQGIPARKSGLIISTAATNPTVSANVSQKTAEKRKLREALPSPVRKPDLAWAYSRSLTDTLTLTPLSILDFGFWITVGGKSKIQNLKSSAAQPPHREDHQAGRNGDYGPEGDQVGHVIRLLGSELQRVPGGYGLHAPDLAARPVPHGERHGGV